MVDVFHDLPRNLVPQFAGGFPWEMRYATSPRDVRNGMTELTSATSGTTISMAVPLVFKSHKRPTGPTVAPDPLCWLVMVG